MALIALGVSGGVGAYKAVEVARGLQQRGHEVAAVLTRAATKFVGPLTFEAITRRPVLTNQFAPGVNADIEHIALASKIALLLVVPATANTIARFANGIADDFLSSLYLAVRAPVLMAPAMNTWMWEHEAVQRNLATLAARGVRFVEPGEGYLACGWIGKGRLAEPADIVAAVEDVLRPAAGTLTGRSILVTAGPTYEDLDPVRYLGNRSSGRMGYAVAAEALRRGARVLLVTGPTALTPPAGAETTAVRSAADMHAAVIERLDECDALIMAAAVADYRPMDVSPHKIKKGSDASEIRLERTVDILAEAGRRRVGARPVLVGFAAETRDVEAYARRKLDEKRVDLMVANDVSRADAGFGVETNAVTLVSREAVEPLPLQSKARAASAILDRVERLIDATPVASSSVAARGQG